MKKLNCYLPIPWFIIFPIRFFKIALVVLPAYFIYKRFAKKNRNKAIIYSLFYAITSSLIIFLLLPNISDFGFNPTPENDTFRFDANCNGYDFFDLLKL